MSLAGAKIIKHAEFGDRSGTWYSLVEFNGKIY
jgi:hypothetical protein